MWFIKLKGDTDWMQPCSDLNPVFYKTFINDLDKNVKLLVKKLLEDLKLSGIVNSL